MKTTARTKATMAALALAAFATPAAAFPGFFDFESENHREPGSSAIEAEKPMALALLDSGTPVNFRSEKSDPVCIRKWPSNYDKPYAGRQVLIGAKADGCDATRKLRLITNGAAHYVGFWILPAPNATGPKSFKVTAVRDKGDTSGPCVLQDPSSPTECFYQEKKVDIPTGSNRWVWLVDPGSKIKGVYVAPDAGAPAVEFGIDGVMVSAE